MDQQLAQFAKGSKTIKEQAQTAVMYTRVSTKEQANNNQSLFRVSSASGDKDTWNKT